MAAPRHIDDQTYVTHAELTERLAELPAKIVEELRRLRRQDRRQFLRNVVKLLLGVVGFLAAIATILGWLGVRA